MMLSLMMPSSVLRPWYVYSRTSAISLDDFGTCGAFSLAQATFSCGVRDSMDGRGTAASTSSSAETGGGTGVIVVSSSDTSATTVTGSMVNVLSDMVTGTEGFATSLSASSRASLA